MVPQSTCHFKALALSNAAAEVPTTTTNVDQQETSVYGTQIDAQKKKPVWRKTRKRPRTLIIPKYAR